MRKEESLLTNLTVKLFIEELRHLKSNHNICYRLIELLMTLNMLLDF